MQNAEPVAFTDPDNLKALIRELARDTGNEAVRVVVTLTDNQQTKGLDVVLVVTHTLGEEKERDVAKICGNVLHSVFRKPKPRRGAKS